MSRLSAIKNNKPLLGGLAVGSVALLAFAAWLAFGFFGIQSAFIDDKVNEAGPVFTSGADASEESSDEATSETDAAEADVAATDTDTDTDADTAEATDEAETDVADASTETTDAEIVTLAEGSFSGLSNYSVNGTASVLNDGSEQRFLRFEDFESSNGPDLKVYLRSADGDFVNLGNLKGNIGSQNYEIPPEVDLSVFNQVDIWCERFSVGFGIATLA